jgi:hypothetical protein
VIEYSGRRAVQTITVTVTAGVLGAEPYVFDLADPSSPNVLPDEIEVTYVSVDAGPWIALSVMVLGAMLNAHGNATTQRVRTRFHLHLPHNHRHHRTPPDWVRDFLHANMPPR